MLERAAVAGMPVDRRAGHAELGGDLSDGAGAFAVGAGLVVHGLGKGDVAWAEFGLLTHGAPPGSCRG